MIYLEDVIFDLEPAMLVEVNQNFLTLMGITTQKQIGERLVVTAVMRNFQVYLQDTNGFNLIVPYDVAQTMRADWIRQTGRIAYEIDYRKSNARLRESRYSHLERII